MKKKLLKHMDAYSKTETIFATEYHNGMEDAWIVKDFVDADEGYTTLPRIFNSEKDAKKYIKNNLNAEYADFVPVFLKSISKYEYTFLCKYGLDENVIKDDGKFYQYTEIDSWVMYKDNKLCVLNSSPWDLGYELESEADEAESDKCTESENDERTDPEFGMESGSLFAEMRKDKTGCYAVKYEEGMEDGWSIFSGDSRPVLIFKTKEEAMTYVRSDKCNYVQIAVPTFWDKEISEEEHQKERKYYDEFDGDLTIRHNNKWYEGEFITEPWDAYIFNNHGDIKIMSKKSLLRLMDECNINIEIRE